MGNSASQPQQEVHPESSHATSPKNSGNIDLQSSTNNANNNDNNNGANNKPLIEANKVNYSSNLPKDIAPISSNKNSSSTYSNQPKEAKKVLPKLPHNCEAIIKDCVGPIDNSSVDNLYQQLYAGVYLNGRNKKYWVEKKGNNNCFAVFASGLSITWGDNPHYWNFLNEEKSDHGNITIAQLRNVCWLEVHGRLHTSNLTPGVTYQVTYLIKLKQTGYGWEVPVNFRLTLPNGIKQEHKQNLSEKPKGEWLRIPVGEFKACHENMGEIEFSLYEYEGGSWKKGLVIKGATIEPKIIV